MQAEQIIEILNSWNFWTKEPDIGIIRADYLKLLETLLKTDQIIALTGVRRSGKSMIIYQFMNNLIKNGVDKKNLLYVNLEEPKFFPELSLDLLQKIYEAYLVNINPGGKPYLFLDEIHHIPSWEKFVRALHEKKEANIIISGSSSQITSKEFGTALTGRQIPLVVSPLDFKEFLFFRGVAIKNRLDIISNRIKIRQCLKEYLEHGSFPLVTLKEGKTEILAAFFDDILNKDIISRYSIDKVDKLKALATYYLTNFSSLTTFRSITKFIDLSLDTIERFSYYLTEPYLIFFIKKFSYSLKEQQVNPKKVYCIDNGLVNVIGFKFTENLGRLYENTVFLHLKQKNKEVYYWKNIAECDFVIKEHGRISEAIQVCYDLNKKNEEREIKGLLEALHFFKLENGIIITEDYDDERKLQNKKIKFIPLWKWLLSNEF